MIVLADEALADLERILEFNLEREPDTAIEHIELIRSAVLILDVHPELGRLVAGPFSLRELVISRGKSGYVALYEYDEANELIRVVAVRHQREAGYRSR